MLSPPELLRRLAALIPSPGTHLIRYHGVFANRSQWRARVPAPPTRETPASTTVLSIPSPAPNTETEPSARTQRQRLSWAQLLARVFLIDVLRCPHCGGRRRILSFITDPRTVRRILAHLELPTDPPPLAPAAVSVELEGELCLDVEPDTETSSDTPHRTQQDREPNDRAPP